MKIQQLLRLAGSVSGLLLLSLLAAPAWAFNSGSTGTDGAFSPTSDTTVVLPADGIINYTTLNIPNGVTVKFAPNAANTPAFILVQGDAVIDGTIDISGIDGEIFSAPPPGGFAGGLPQQNVGGTGQGPGGSTGGPSTTIGGNGGSYGTQGTTGTNNLTTGLGLVYGSTSLLPQLGGSGGGASASSSTVSGNRGGSGGGAILLAASGTLTINGAILANGGDGSPVTGNNLPGAGGGSGGSVRIIASTLTGTGTIDFSGGVRGAPSNIISRAGGFGGIGRARLEADVFNFTGTAIPSTVVSSLPQSVFASNLPTIRITTVGGTAVPASPTGENDVILPTSIINPVTVEFAATGVPLGSTIELTVTPVTGAATTSTSTGLAGTEASSTASASATLPNGASVLLASVSFAVTTTTASLFTPFTNGEMVARVELRSSLGGGPSRMILTMQSGNIIEVPAYAARL